MAIDTRYVAIVPKFDTRSFNNIKKKIEEIGKGLSEIKVGYKLNANALSGLKAQIGKKIKDDSHAVILPVTYSLTNSSLSALKSEVKTKVASGKFNIEIPVRFTLRGAKKDLQEQIQRFRVTPFIVPVTLRATKDSIDRVRRQAGSAGNAGGGGGSGGGSGSGFNRSDGFGGRVGSAFSSSAAYGLAGGVLYGATEAVKNGFLSAKNLETNLLYLQSVYSSTGKTLTNEQFQSIKDKTLDTAATLPINVTDASDAMRILAKNGAKAEDIMGGMFDAAVKSSLALRTNVGVTADFMTDVGRTFKISASDYNRLSKTLVGTAFASKFDVQDVWYAFAQAGGQASASGLTPEELGALLVTTQATAKSGRDLGTQLKNLLRFFTVPKSKASAKLMSQFGLTAFDETGSITNVKQWVEQLSELMKLPDDKRLQVINEIFGADASKGVISLISGQLEEFSTALTTINNVDVDKAVADQTSGVDGAWKNLISKLESLANTIFNDRFMEAMKDFLDTLSSVTLALQKFAEDIGTIFGGLNSLLENVVPGYKQLSRTISGSNKPLSDEGDALDFLRHISPFSTSVQESRILFNQMELNKIPTLRENFLKNKLLYGENTPEMSFAHNLRNTSNMSQVSEKNMTQNIIFNGPVNEPETITNAVSRGNRSVMRDNDSLNNGLIYLN